MTRRKRTQFWGSHVDDDRLVIEVMLGRKTATVCKADEYFTASGEFDDGNMQVGDLVDVYDLRERYRCTIRVTEVYALEFGTIPEYVGKLYRTEVVGVSPKWSEQNFAHWISKKPAEEFPGLVAEKFDEI